MNARKKDKSNIQECKIQTETCKLQVNNVKSVAKDACSNCAVVTVVCVVGGMRRDYVIT